MQSLQLNRVLGVLKTSTVLFCAAFTTQAVADDDNRQIEEVIVTAQRASESIQDVPIAVTALSGDMLEDRQILGATDLQMNAPNVTFTATNFGGSSFSIRGIGRLVIAASGENGVSTHLNDIPLGTNLSAVEFVDVSRVEVLRGPQGTLYGRNATGGAINVVTNMPEVDGVKGMLDAEMSSYNGRRYKGMLNIPITDTIAVRFAGMQLDRDGYITNLAYGQENAAGETLQGINKDIDGRNLWTGRITASWAFSDNGEAWIQYSKFSENDDRARITNQICVTNDVPLQGCKPGEFGFDGPHLGSTTGGIFGGAFGAQIFGDKGNGLPGTATTYSYARPQLGFRTMHTDFEPIYQSEEDVVSLGVDYRFDNYEVSFLGAYQETESLFQQDYNMDVGPDLITGSGLVGLLGLTSYPTSAPAGGAGADWIAGTPCNYIDGTAGVPGGCIADVDQSRVFSYDQSSSTSEYWTAEVRLSSQLDGPLNFLVGASAYDSGGSGDYYVFANTLDLLGTVTGAFPGSFNSTRAPDNKGLETDGHAYFAEVYYDLNDRTKVTFGLRRNKDNKFIADANAFLDASFINAANPSLGYTRVPDFVAGDDVDADGLPTYSAARAELYGATALFEEAKGTAAYSDERLAASAAIPLVPQPGERRKLTGSPQNFTWEETTGRLGVDYQLSDDSLLYAFYSVGYKPGGFNPPISEAFQGNIKFDFDQEEISSIEIGSKNTLLDGTMKLNGSLFVYDYEGLQITRIANNSSINDNIDAEMWGAEIEFEWYPDMLPGVSIDGAYSYLDTEVANGSESVDPTNRTAGLPEWTTVNEPTPGPTAGVNYVVDTQAFTDNLAALTAAGVTLPLPGTVRANGLPAYVARAGLESAVTPGTAGPAGVYVPNSNGIAQELGGNSLPNSPEHTLKLGVAYAMPSPVFDGDLIVRLDYYWQDDMYAREFNTGGDVIESWDQFNLSLIFESADGKWGARAWARNLADEDNITGHYLTSDTSGFYRNYFLTEPRIVGASIRYNFGY
jgi:outer membrane receptor protein involved in Fe transport